MKQAARRKTAFTKIPKTIGVSEFRADLAANLAKAKKHPIVISERRGDDAYVILSSKSYNALVDAREDAEDAAELTRLIKEHGNGPWIDWKP
jgi:PHD/YefM family antitoxin component YafN of YafNO toxin-antitoxin module